MPECEPDSLFHYIKCPVLYHMFRSFWGQTTGLPRKNHLLHDFIIQVLLRNLQNGIVVMGIIDALFMLIISTADASRILETLEIV